MIAAGVAFAGLPLDGFLQTKDGFERNLWVAIAKEILELQQKRDQNLAILTANAVGKMLGGK
jgi:hypothetical protein